MDALQPRRKRQQGNALVEFALAALILTPVLLGTVAFGNAMKNYQSLQNGVRNAARYASAQDYDSWTATPSAQFTAAARNVVLYGNPTGTGNARVPGLLASHIQVVVQFEANVPKTVSVSVSGYPLIDFFYPITLSGNPRATFPYAGRFAPPV